MPFANRSDLRTSIQNWLMRPADTELTSAVLNDIIAIAEADIFRRLEDLADCETHNSAFSVSAEFTALPAGFRGFRRAPRVVGSIVYPLKLASPTQIDSETDPNTPDLPRLYCIEANELRLGPIPSGATTLDMTYLARAAAIGDATSNFLLDDNPDLYLFGALVKSAPYIGEDGRMQIWKGEYETAMAGIKASDRRRKWSGTPGEMRIVGGTP